MQIGMIGLGRMGGNMARRLLRGRHECVVFDRSAATIDELVREGATGAASLAEFVARLARPRIVWLMLPAGPPTEEMIAALSRRLDLGDIVVDGGNTYFKDDVRRARELSGSGVEYVDVGTSGGVWGLERGYCLMIGGRRETAEYLDPIFKTLAPGLGEVPRTREDAPPRGTAEEGYLYCGPVGSGHFVKMIHNGLEYGLMQAYAEGFDILRHAGSESLPEDLRYDLDTAAIAEVWRRGSVVRSWLLDLIALALAENPDLSRYSGFVQDSGEGRWTIQTAIEEAVPATVLSASLYARFRSRRDHTFGEKLLSAMREKFGGHTEPR